MVSDAYGSWGCGAFVKGPQLLWSQLKWPDHWENIHITAKELVPIIVGAAIWGHRWSKQLVCFVSDNMAVVQILTKWSARDPVVSHLHVLRCLFFFLEAAFIFEFCATHIPKRDNTGADALLEELVFSQVQMSWTSPHWWRLFLDTLYKV